MTRTIVLGAGVVGSAAIHDLVRRGHAVTVADVEPGAVAAAQEAFPVTGIGLDAADTSAVRNLLRTFFDGSVEAAVASLIGAEGKNLTDEELARLSKLIEEARKGE